MFSLPLEGEGLFYPLPPFGGRLDGGVILSKVFGTIIAKRIDDLDFPAVNTYNLAKFSFYVGSGWWLVLPPDFKSGEPPKRGLVGSIPTHFRQ